MIKKISLGLTVAAALTGCGGSDSSGGSGSEGAKTFSINNYIAITPSSSLEGTWVAINNYSVSGVEDGITGTRTVSQKRYITIFQHTDDNIYYSVCDSSSSKLFNLYNHNKPEMFGEELTITDNNKMTVTFDSYSHDETWDFIKVSNENSGLGNVSINWSGNTDKSDGTYTAFGTCEKYTTEVGGGFTEIQHELTVGFAEDLQDSLSTSTQHYVEAYRDLVDDGYDAISLHVGTTSLSPSQSAGESVNISLTEGSDHSLTANLSATDNNYNVSFILNTQINPSK